MLLHEVPAVAVVVVLLDIEDDRSRVQQDVSDVSRRVPADAASIQPAIRTPLLSTSSSSFLLWQENMALVRAGTTCPATDCGHEFRCRVEQDEEEGGSGQVDGEADVPIGSERIRWILFQIGRKRATDESHADIQ